MSFPVPLPSTFMPLPLAIMIPFMGIQSGVMAQQFGMNFQYGKRKISAMSNEEFNKLTPQQMQADFQLQIKGMIPTFQQALEDMRPFQRMIFVEMLAVFKEALELGLDVAKAGVDPLAHIFGQHVHGGTPTSKTPPPDIDEHLFLSPAEILEHKKHGHLGGIPKSDGTTKKPSPSKEPSSGSDLLAKKKISIRIVSLNLASLPKTKKIVTYETSISELKSLLKVMRNIVKSNANKNKKVIAAWNAQEILRVLRVVFGIIDA